MALLENGQKEGRRKSAPGAEGAGRAIEALVVAAFGLGTEDLASARRGAADIAFARQVAMYLAHTRVGLPLTTVGRMFRRDRTTARHACRQVEDRRDDPRVDSLLACLERGLDVAAEIARYRTRGRLDA